MAEAIPNLWPKKFERGILAPLAVLRVQANKFKEMTDGLLQAEVSSSVSTSELGKDVRVHSFEIVAPALDYYRRVILTAEHAMPGAYPVLLRSEFASSRGERWTSAAEAEESQVFECDSQESLFAALRSVFGSPHLSTLIESLIAQINDLEAVPA